MPILGPRRIGLALGSGAARGLAHIGVLKVLEAEGLVPDAIAGTSMGAMVGAFFAAGHPAVEVERIARGLDIQSFMGLGDVALTRGAVFSGDKLTAFLREHLPETFEELAVPFGCVATDLTRNRAVRFTSGDLVSAVRASVSVPLALLPVTMDGMLLVDGYVSEPVPVTLARHLGGQAIVAVAACGTGTVTIPEAGERGEVHRLRELRAAVKSGEPFERGTSAVEILGAVSEAFECRLTEPALKRADVVIAPDVSAYGGFEFAQAEQLIAEGERAAREAVTALRRAARR
jgi:NTE family protein